MPKKTENAASAAAAQRRRRKLPLAADVAAAAPRIRRGQSTRKRRRAQTALPAFGFAHARGAKDAPRKRPSKWRRSWCRSSGGAGAGLLCPDSGKGASRLSGNRSFSKKGTEVQLLKRLWVNTFLQICCCFVTGYRAQLNIIILSP